MSEHSEKSLDKQYAAFCGLGDCYNYRHRYELGLKNFRKFIVIPGLSGLGFDWESRIPALIAGIEHIEIPDSNGYIIIGELTVTITQNPSNYRVRNLTPNGDYAHPHAPQNSQFCMTSGREEIMNAIKDGMPSLAMSIIVKAARMRPGTYIPGNPYRALNTWPFRRNGAK